MTDDQDPSGLVDAILDTLEAAAGARESLRAGSAGWIPDGPLKYQIAELDPWLDVPNLFSVQAKERIRMTSEALFHASRREYVTEIIHDEHCMSEDCERSSFTERGRAIAAARIELDGILTALRRVEDTLEADRLCILLRQTN
ncbi:hypothetical protein [Limimaricola sp. AA108-03]|uniref:hypothetical protein n=1 Tax=Limimaricola sp. AA108-03 TaxID=3425945 RepID=UPI003D789310